MKENYWKYIQKECFEGVGFFKGIIRCFFVYGMYNSLFCLRLYQIFSQKKMKLFSLIARNILIKRYNIYIGANTRIGKGLIMPHPTSIVFGQGAQIGENAIVFQNTTIGSKEVGKDEAFYPKIGDNCVICAGASILASKNGLTVGNNSVIGANSVLFQSVGENSICIGTPARVVKKK